MVDSNPPWLKRVLIPFWIIQLLAMAVLVAAIALALNIVGASLPMYVPKTSFTKMPNLCLYPRRTKNSISLTCFLGRQIRFRHSSLLCHLHDPHDNGNRAVRPVEIAFHHLPHTAGCQNGGVGHRVHTCARESFEQSEFHWGFHRRSASCTRGFDSGDRDFVSCSSPPIILKKPPPPPQHSPKSSSKDLYPSNRELTFWGGGNRLAFIGTLIYASVIFHRDRKGRFSESHTRLPSTTVATATDIERASSLSSGTGSQLPSYTPYRPLVEQREVVELGDERGSAKRG